MIEGGGGEMLELRVCIIGCVCVPLIGGGEATLTHPNERGLGCERGNPWKIIPTLSLSFLQDKKNQCLKVYPNIRRIDKIAKNNTKTKIFLWDFGLINSVLRTFVWAPKVPFLDK